MLPWVFLVGGLVGWPLSMLTVAKDEPPFVLSLSWLAILIEGFNAVGIHDGEDES